MLEMHPPNPIKPKIVKLMNHKEKIAICYAHMHKSNVIFSFVNRKKKLRQLIKQSDVIISYIISFTLFSSIPSSPYPSPLFRVFTLLGTYSTKLSFKTLGQ